MESHTLWDPRVFQLSQDELHSQASQTLGNHEKLSTCSQCCSFMLEIKQYICRRSLVYKMQHYTRYPSKKVSNNILALSQNDGHYESKSAHGLILLKLHTPLIYIYMKDVKYGWTLTSIAGLVHVFDLDLTTQIFIFPSQTCYHTKQVWHGETKIWFVRSRSFTWTSPAMLVNVSCVKQQSYNCPFDLWKNWLWANFDSDWPSPSDIPVLTRIQYPL